VLTNLLISGPNAVMIYTAAMMPYLIRADLNNTIGVQDGTLYDILDDNNGTGNVAVGATSFNVTCGSLPSVTVTGDSSDAFWVVNTTVSTDSPLYGLNFNLSAICKEVIYLRSTMSTVFFFGSTKCVGIYGPYGKPIFGTGL
jgi:hypothetical protein